MTIQMQKSVSSLSNAMHLHTWMQTWPSACSPHHWQQPGTAQCTAAGGEQWNTAYLWGRNSHVYAHDKIDRQFWLVTEEALAHIPGQTKNYYKTTLHAGLGFDWWATTDSCRSCILCTTKTKHIKFSKPETKSDVRVKQSLYRLGQALMVPGGWGSLISWQ